MVDIEVFNDVPLFALLDADERQVLAQQVGLRQFKEGEAVFRAGEVGGLAYLLQQGEIEVSIVNVEGEVIGQAFTPFHPSIQFARRHDFLGFYEQELGFREQLRYPPFTRAAMLTFRSRNEDKARLTADYVKTELDKGLTAFRDLILAGPAPSPLLKVETYYRYQIMLRTRQMSKLSLALAGLLKKIQLPEDVSMMTDIDPVNLI